MKKNQCSKESSPILSALAGICILILSTLIADTTFATQPKSDRKKVIDFDGDLVEGVNKSPYGSLNQVSEAQKRRNVVHLYHKRKGFRSEVRGTLKNMRYLP